MEMQEKKMDNDDEPIGWILSRRDALKLLGPGGPGSFTSGQELARGLTRLKSIL